MISHFFKKNLKKCAKMFAKSAIMWYNTIIGAAYASALFEERKVALWQR